MNERGKSVDSTYLSVENARERGFLHRDNIAHCLRWSHVCKRLSERKAYQSARILDVGCGRELPLASTLYSSRLIPKQYYGVDVGPIEDGSMEKFRTGKFPLLVYENTDVLALSLGDLGDELVEWVTCFEVLEHVEPGHMLQMLRHIKSLLQVGGKAFFSTPCWNVIDCAANHVNEMRYEALGAIFEANGWTVVNTWGTFASIRDYEAELGPLGLTETFDKLRAYYDTNVLSCIFAPLFPSQSRNALWELRNSPTPAGKEKFHGILHVPQPWGSSDHWKEMAG